MNLQEFFTENPRVAIAFSGGVDSSYLLYAALHHGARARAYYVNSAFQPAFELEDARRLAEELGGGLGGFGGGTLWRTPRWRRILPTGAIFAKG